MDCPDYVKIKKVLRRIQDRFNLFVFFFKDFMALLTLLASTISGLILIGMEGETKIVQVQYGTTNNEVHKKLRLLLVIL